MLLPLGCRPAERSGRPLNYHDAVEAAYSAGFEQDEPEADARARAEAHADRLVSSLAARLAGAPASSPQQQQQQAWQDHVIKPYVLW